VVCAHDCPDMCSLLAHVENGRITRIEGDPDQPFTAGFACAKVNRDAELVHSPERLATPLRRIGAKGEGKFTPIGWMTRSARSLRGGRRSSPNPGLWHCSAMPKVRTRAR
jgi:anaerobic selenocysteine-containing dehydrogenase